MLTSKQRATLRAIANPINTIFQVGKGGIGDALITQINDALRVREIIKLKVLDNASYSAQEVSIELSEKTHSEVVQVIGNKVVLYKRNPKDPVINLK